MYRWFSVFNCVFSCKKGLKKRHFSSIMKKNGDYQKGIAYKYNMFMGDF